MPDKPKRTWVTRCSEPCGMYNFYYRFKQPTKRSLSSCCWKESSRSLTTDEFNKRYPDVELNFGEGPIEIKEEIYEIRNGKVIRD